MSKDFDSMRTELPENWYVVRTPENAQVLNCWANGVCEFPEEWNRIDTHGYISHTGESYTALPMSLMEIEKITYEEFTKLVLKKNV